MSYRMVGIDVHKRCWPYSCPTSKSKASTSLSGGCLAATLNNYDRWRHGCSRARDRRSSHGIDGPILETSVGSAGKVLEADMREARRRKAEVRNVALGAGTIQSRTTGTQEGFSRCRTPGEAAGGPGIDFELCARCRAAFVADSNCRTTFVGQILPI